MTGIWTAFVLLVNLLIWRRNHFSVAKLKNIIFTFHCLLGLIVAFNPFTPVGIICLNAC